jgi:hypothetical protein
MVEYIHRNIYRKYVIYQYIDHSIQNQKIKKTKTKNKTKPKPKTKQNKTKQNKTKQNKTKQNKTELLYKQGANIRIKRQKRINMSIQTTINRYKKFNNFSIKFYPTIRSQYEKDSFLSEIIKNDSSNTELIMNCIKYNSEFGYISNGYLVDSIKSGCSISVITKIVNKLIKAIDRGKTTHEACSFDVALYTLLNRIKPLDNAPCGYISEEGYQLFELLFSQASNLVGCLSSAIMNFYHCDKMITTIMEYEQPYCYTLKFAFNAGVPEKIIDLLIKQIDENNKKYNENDDKNSDYDVLYDVVFTRVESLDHQEHILSKMVEFRGLNNLFISGKLMSYLVPNEVAFAGISESDIIKRQNIISMVIEKSEITHIDIKSLIQMCKNQIYKKIDDNNKEFCPSYAEAYVKFMKELINKSASFDLCLKTALKYLDSSISMFDEIIEMLLEKTLEEFNKRTAMSRDKDYMKKCLRNALLTRQDNDKLINTLLSVTDNDLTQDCLMIALTQRPLDIKLHRNLFEKTTNFDNCLNLLFVFGSYGVIDEKYGNSKEVIELYTKLAYDIALKTENYEYVLDNALWWFPYDKTLFDFLISKTENFGGSLIRAIISFPENEELIDFLLEQETSVYEGCLGAALRGCPKNRKLLDKLLQSKDKNAFDNDMIGCIDIVLFYYPEDINLIKTILDHVYNDDYVFSDEEYCDGTSSKQDILYNKKFTHLLISCSRDRDLTEKYIPILDHVFENKIKSSKQTLEFPIIYQEKYIKKFVMNTECFVCLCEFHDEEGNPIEEVHQLDCGHIIHQGCNTAHVRCRQH